MKILQGISYIYITETLHIQELNQGFFAIRWKLNSSLDACLENPCESSFLHLLLDGLKRLLAKSVTRKEPITSEMLHKIVLKYGNSNDLKDCRLCAIMLLSYAAFLRFDELSNLKICDIDLTQSHIKLFLEKKQNRSVPRRCVGDCCRDWKSHMSSPYVREVF